MIAPAQEAHIAAARDALQALFPELIGAWLFGSALTGQLRADSDIDLAVWCGLPIDGVRRFEVQRELGVMLDRDVDLVDLATAGTLLGKEVVADGIVLLQRDPDAVLDFHARTLSDYARLMDATRDIRESIRRDGLAIVP